MPAAQSFIQILGTFLAKLFDLIKAHLSNIKKNLFMKKIGKSIGNT
tara:strand:+ start:440 stop:577 length:138 start_codon:yes stop_codon:yes gene_type:complete